MPIDWNQVPNEPANAYEFFRLFSRFEFALKQLGYFTGQAKIDRAAKPDWDAYGGSFDAEKLLDWEQLKNKAPTICRTPPQKQMVNADNALNWKSMGAPIDVVTLLQAVRRIRNNLFHGGKSGDPDRNRNETLIDEGIAVLTFVLENDENLRHEFEGLV